MEDAGKGLEKGLGRRFREVDTVIPAPKGADGASGQQEQRSWCRMVPRALSFFRFAFLPLEVRNCSDTQPRGGRRWSRSGNPKGARVGVVVEGQDVKRN